MSKKSFLLTLLAFWSSCHLALAAAVMPNTPSACNNPATWLKPTGDAIIATEGRIKAMNKAMLSSTMKNLATHPTTLQGTTLSNYLNHFTMDYDQYINGRAMTRAMGDALVADAKANIPSTVKVKYGIVTKRSDLRSFPTLSRAFSTPSDVNFDNWQETAVDPGEGALILHKNGRGNFVFVQLASYRGWLPANQVAITDRETFLNLTTPASFAVVTDKLLTVSGAGSSHWLYQMGAKLPLSTKGLLILPLRDKKGYLTTVEMPAPFGSSLHKGYLPYTHNNIVRMSFKHLGAPYGWGGMKNSVDCSSLAQDVYRTMGVELPRNGDEQENAWPGQKMTGLSWNQREKLVKDLPTGSLLFTPYHVMLYLGQYNNRPYMLHSLGSYGSKNANGSFSKNRIMQVVVSDIYLPGGSGTSLLTQMTKANTYK